MSEKGEGLVERLRDKHAHSAEAYACEEYLPMAEFWKKYADLSNEAADRITALEAALRAVSDTSHRARDRKHYRFPIAIMEKVDAALERQP